MNAPVAAATIVVRAAAKTDLPAILRLYAQPAVDDGKTLSLSEAEALLDRMSAYPDYRLYVAELDGRIVGSFALLIMDNLAHLGAPSAVVEDVVVAPADQHRGIGKAMMHYAMAYCRHRGCYKLTLSANLIREQAHAFYARLGFERHGYSFIVTLKTETEEPTIPVKFEIAQGTDQGGKTLDRHEAQENSASDLDNQLK